MKPLAPAHVRDLVPYPPGKPIEEVRRELGIEGEVIKLASNENALGPSPRAVEAAREAVAGVHRYPDGGGFYLKRRLSEHVGVSASRIALGNGSNDLIDLILRAFVGPDEAGVISATTFVIYRMVLQGLGRQLREVPLSGLAYDLDAMAAAVDARTKVVFLATPNNPTGLHLGAAALDRFLGRIPDGVVVVVDEAYAEYVTADDYPDSVALQARRPRTITLRTFSKAYGLAGLRCGYGVASEEVVGLLDRVRQPFNCSAVAQAAALAALDDTAHIERSRRFNAEGIAQLSAGFEALGLSPVPTQANFVLVRLPRPGRPVYDALLRRGVIVRPMDGYGLPDCLRITVGTPAENVRCLDALGAVLRER